MMNGIGCGKGSNIVQHRDSTPVFAGRDCVKQQQILGSRCLGLDSNLALPKYKTEALLVKRTCSAFRISGLILVRLRVVQKETYPGFNPGLENVSRGVFVDFPRPSKQIIECLKIGHDNFLTRSFLFVIRLFVTLYSEFVTSLLNNTTNMEDLEC